MREVLPLVWQFGRDQVSGLHAGLPPGYHWISLGFIWADQIASWLSLDFIGFDLGGSNCIRDLELVGLH